jgi:predicted small secreted protein
MTINHLILAASVSLFALLAGCDTQEGPAEQAGENIDNAMENAGEQIEEAGESIQEKANN